MPANKFAVGNIKQALTQKNLVILLIVLALAIFIFNNKRWFVPAIVNGSPITGVELISRLNRDFRTQTLDNMINEKIILDEARKRKKNAIPTKQEIDAKIAEIEGQFGGADAFNSLLAAQGQTRASLGEQMMIQLAIEKMFAAEATASGEEIDEYIKTNKTAMTATDSAGQKQEAENALKQQKIQQLFLTRFEELKKAANVKIF